MRVGGVDFFQEIDLHEPSIEYFFQVLLGFAANDHELSTDNLMCLDVNSIILLIDEYISGSSSDQKVSVRDL